MKVIYHYRIEDTKNSYTFLQEGYHLIGIPITELSKIKDILEKEKYKFEEGKLK